MAFSNVTIFYYEPQLLISCQNYTAKLLYGLPANNTARVLGEGVSVLLTGTNTFLQPVTEPITNVTGMPTCLRLPAKA